MNEEVVQLKQSNDKLRAYIKGLEMQCELSKIIIEILKNKCNLNDRELTIRKEQIFLSNLINLSK